LVPIPPSEKGPRTAGWQSQAFVAGDFPPGGNVGLLLGPRSGEIVDVDLDCTEALALADLYLFKTGAVFGRATKPRSHRLYVARGAVYETCHGLHAPRTTSRRKRGRRSPDLVAAERCGWRAPAMGGAVIAPAVVEAFAVAATLCMARDRLP
jgi:hypothetical protein